MWTSRNVEGNGKKNNGFPVCIKAIELEKLVDSMAGYDENRIILGGRDELQILDIKTGKKTPLSNEHNGRINVVIKISNNEIVTAGQDKTIKICKIEQKNSLEALEWHKYMIWSINEIKGDKLISGSSDDRAIIWDLKYKKLDFELYKGKEISVALQLKSGNVLLWSNSKLMLFDLNTKKPLTTMEIKLGVWSIRELSDGTVAAGYGNGDIGILEVGSEIKTKLVLKGHKKKVNCIIELDNHKLVSSSDEKSMILWDLTDPEGKYFIEGHTDNANTLVHITGNKFASASKDKTFKIWE